ncbi:hypothetical protein [Massilia sp. NP310]|uniref:hypothetical protein n=1 Tax=Massilia sp. NP310 TaxID=2861282 RepID=UPI001C63105E|nr:hypothetical protein [Massilia sp. NP310]QYG00150.1 hypothetical protein KY496_17355 [Massilia sp. NP310]
MNASEHIVDAYFRLVLGCFTLGDKKVVKGNNRQLDLLAYHLKTREAFHIEVAVTHQMNWCVRLEELGPHFDKKFFGLPDERKGAANGTTDFEKGKVYWEQINATYEDVGFEPDQVKRVWVCWIIKGADGAAPIETQFYSKHLNRTFPIQILSLRDFVLPRLQDKIGTANYDDELLRVLGFVKQRELQTAMVPRRRA